MQFQKSFISLSAVVCAISIFIVSTKDAEITKENNQEILFGTAFKQKEERVKSGEPIYPPATQTKHEKTAEKEVWKSSKVKKGDSLSVIFKRLNVPLEDLAKITAINKDISDIQPGQLIKVGLRSNEVVFISKKLNSFDTLVFSKTDNGGYLFQKEQIEPNIKLESKTSIINSSLFVDAQRAGLEDKMIMKLTEIFAWDIDYSQDLRPGDSFKVIYERLYKGENFVSTGRILAAEFKNQGNTYRAALFPLDQKKSEYYSESGSAMRKAFLRTPVEFSRISSRFNLRRKHPILNRIRAHTGVDYAAPVGTPVKSTAKGKVIKRNWEGGYGKTVVIQHGNKYSTLYAHLSRFKKGISVGTNVIQGQIIGYVGSTGLATGPHLHYEFRVNKKHKNPLKYQYPSAEPIASDLRESFARQADPLFNFLKDKSINEDTFNESSFTTLTQ